MRVGMGHEVPPSGYHKAKQNTTENKGLLLRENQKLAKGVKVGITVSTGENQFVDST